MRTMVAITALMALTCAPAASSAQDVIPDLTGRWSADLQIMMVDRIERGPPRAVEATLVFDVTWQEGARFSGQEVSHQTSADAPQPTSVEEYFAGVIGTGNQSAHIVDENGMRDCWITAPDSMACVYRHIEDHRAVVSRETWSRLPG